MAAMNPYVGVSAAGLLILMGLAWLVSPQKNNINFRVISGGLALQFLLALFIFKVPFGQSCFLFLNHAVTQLLGAASAGMRFVFGPLAIPPGESGSLGFILAFQAFPTILFFSALVSLLYFSGIMPFLIRLFARLFTRLMRLSGAESVTAASNIFVGVESALTVRPYLARMTRSELCTVLTVGMATVASNILMLYVVSLQSVFPTITGHLLSASLLSAPAALIMAKLVLPEAGQPETLGIDIHPQVDRPGTAFEAIIQGANAGVKMIVGIVALLIAVLGLVELVDLGLRFTAGQLQNAFGLSVDLSLRSLLGWLFYPLTLIIGVPPADAGAVARLIGERLVLTEVVAYQDLAALLQAGTLTQMRSAIIAAYALCGFAHLASMAIFVGGTAALVPQRMPEIAGVAVRALWAATLACLMTAAIAGIFCPSDSFLLGN